MPILSQRSMLLAKVETTQGVDAVPTPSTDAILVFDPSYSVNVNMIDRDPARRDFSNYQAIPGRTFASLRFSVEVAGSGTAVTAPRWSRLLRGCSMAQSTQTSTSKTIAASPTGAVRSSNVTTITTSAAHTFSPGQSVVIAGVTDSSFNGQRLILTTPTGTTFTVSDPGTNGTSGSGTASLVAGEFFQPKTDNQETLTLYLYHDGQLHKLLGCMGTFSLQGEAGNIVKAEFTFTGTYSDPTSTTFPTGETYPDEIPSLMEFAGLTFAGSGAYAANAFKMDIANNVVPRIDMNYGEGIRSFRISGRKPTMGFDPEVETAYNFYQRFTGSNPTTNPLTAAFQVKVGAASGGNVAGQTIQIDAPAAQVTGIDYQDRDGLRTFDLGFALRRSAPTGNDELSFLFV